MNRSESLSRIEQLVLLALARLEGDAYGVTIRREIDERAGRGVSTAAVYAALDRLEDRGKETVVGDVAPALWILMAAVSIVVVAACVNVASLFLAQAEYRRQEVAVRVALGAGRGDLQRHFLAESALLAIAGGGLGVALAVGGVRALVAYGPEGIPRLHEVAVDLRALLFSAALVIATGFMFGATPLPRHSRIGISSALRERGRGAPASRGGSRVRGLLVASQAALAVVLMSASLLTVQSFWRLYSVDPGFERDGVVTAFVTLPFGPYSTHEAAAGFFRDLLERMRGLPGGEAAGAISDAPLGRVDWAELSMLLDVEGRAPSGDLERQVPIRMVMGDYFRALRIPLLEGGVPPVGGDVASPVLLSASLARRLFAGERAVGQRIGLRWPGRPAGPEERAWSTVVGVVGDVRDESLATMPGEILYMALPNRAMVASGLSPGAMALVLRTELPAQSIAPALRAVVRGIDPDVPITHLASMQELVAADTARPRFTMLLLLISALSALFLAAVGLYGLISYGVSRRTREIGVRMALGAGAADVGGMVVREGLRLTSLGLLVGLLAALWMSRLLAGLLYEVGPYDPLTFAAAALLLLAVAWLASAVPARRAARVDPAVAFRSE